jgi:hypothetical protein
VKAYKIFVPTDGCEGAITMDYRGEVTLSLKADTSWSPCSDIRSDSHITLNLGDIIPTGDLHKKVYVVTIEEAAPNTIENDQRAYYARLIREKEAQDLKEAGMSNDMIRRLKNV